MLIGYNNDIEYRDKTFHIQTEDRGLSDCKIETQIFHSGAILDTRITSYEKYRDLDEDERNRKVEALMKASHRDLYRKLLGGEYDAFAGLEPLDDGERSEVFEEAHLEPGQDRVPAGALEIERKGPRCLRHEAGGRRAHGPEQTQGQARRYQQRRGGPGRGGVLAVASPGPRGPGAAAPQLLARASRPPHWVA